MIVDLQYFGDLTYYKNIVESEYVEFLQFQPYEKRLFLNRAVIATANGPLKISVPIEKGRNQRTVFKDVRVAKNEYWQARHWKSITSAYNGSPWFVHYHDEMAQLYAKRFTFLLDWNLATFEWTVQKLQLPVSFILNPSASDSGQGLNPATTLPVYTQVFQERHGFFPDLCVLDLLFCVGPTVARALLQPVWPAQEDVKGAE